MKLSYILLSCKKMLIWTFRFIGRNIVFKVPIAILRLIKRLFNFAVNPNNTRKIVLTVLVLTLMYIA
jgi:hypothetical protein